MKEKVFLILLSILLVLFFIRMGGIWVYKQKEYKRIINVLTLTTPHDVRIFRVYPKLIEKPVDFNVPDPIIHDFFQSLTDLRSYNPAGRDTALQNQQWLFEVADNNEMIQIAFHIPYQVGGFIGYRKGGDFVVGEIIKSESHSPYYGRFQSRQLYQWYQQYSHRWLTPESSPPAPQP